MELHIDVDKEEWVDIVNHVGYYQVSNLGRVRSLDTIVPRIRKHGPSDISKKGKVLIVTDNGNGYLFIRLHAPIKKNYYIHRLVATAFLPNPLNLREVNHLDGNKKNNCLYNLEWISSSQNKIHAHNTGLIRPSKEWANTISLIDTDTLQVFGTIKEASKFYGVNYSTLKNVLIKGRKGIQNPLYRKLIKFSDYESTH